MPPSSSFAFYIYLYISKRFYSYKDTDHHRRTPVAQYSPRINHNFFLQSLLFYILRRLRTFHIQRIKHCGISDVRYSYRNMISRIIRLINNINVVVINIFSVIWYRTTSVINIHVLIKPERGHKILKPSVSKRTREKKKNKSVMCNAWPILTWKILVRNIIL